MFTLCTKLNIELSKIHCIIRFVYIFIVIDFSYLSFKAVKSQRKVCFTALKYDFRHEIEEKLR